MLMICDCLCRGEARYYLTSRSGFRVSGAPSNNKALEEKTPTTAIEKCPIEKTATSPIEKHPIEGVGQESAPEKRSKSKGKESGKEAVGGQCHPLVMKDLCEMGERGPRLEVLHGSRSGGSCREAAADLDAKVERLKAALGSAKQEDQVIITDPPWLNLAIVESGNGSLICLSLQMGLDPPLFDEVEVLQQTLFQGIFFKDLDPKGQEDYFER
ncbi:hypothetical protein BHE74_00009937 [Ensete ventricosum]|nr:hypothetical protein BHE74_00009937 [Ensete ventricosum]RZR82401.1 hypothetical protein BHM03_00008801 [Ensete ventricosum]